jgi:sirohydrochlorin cobaltochelatase
MNTPSNHKRGTILFGHGSRDKLWHLPMEAVADRVRAIDPATCVRCAYLELTAPDLPTCASEMAELGLTHISVLPLFLGVGRHAREDLPLLMQALQQQHPRITFELKPAVGEDAKVIELLAQIALS